MQPVGPKLRELRLKARPSLSIRGMADALGMPHASYNFYEREQAYKKPYLPIDLTRKIAAILAARGVDPALVMMLAGLKDGEAEPEARDIEAQRPTLVSINLPVVLPSEDALRDMFRSLLVLVPDGATKDEAAKILARRLPSGLAAIGPLSLDPSAAVSIVGNAVPQSPATDPHESAPSSRT